MALLDDITRAISETIAQPRGAARVRATAWGTIAEQHANENDETAARHACLMAARSVAADSPTIATIWRSVLLANPR